MKTYEQYLKEYDRDIRNICRNLKKEYNSARIELDDLYQEASVALLYLYRNQSIDSDKCILSSRNYSLVAIRHKLIDWLRKETSTNVTDPITGKSKRVVKPLYQSQNKGLIIW